MRENKSGEKKIGKIDRKIFIDVFVSVDIGAVAAAAISVVVAVVAIVSMPSQKAMMRSNIKANQYMCVLLLFSQMIHTNVKMKEEFMLASYRFIFSF